MVTVNAFGVIFLYMASMVKLYLRKAVACFVQWNNVFNILIFRFNPGMALLAFYRSPFLFMAIFAEIMKDYHF